MALTELNVPLQQAACVHSLQGRVSEPLFGQGSIFGRVNDGGFWIEERLWYRNAFKTRVVGVFTKTASGTRVDCTGGMQPFVLYVVYAWFALVAGACLFVAALAPAAALVPILMLAAGGGLLALGRYAARDEEARLLAFVRNCLQADGA